MRLHLEKDNFTELLRIIGNTSNIDTDILEKDYYVCVVLYQLSKNQDVLKAYFKGGTALYKKLDDMRRFSEDIDLTVRDDESLSNTQNKKKFERSAKGYSIDGLTLLPDKTDNRKGSITAFYEYQTIVEYIINPLRRTGEIQVETTSFTESEPLEDCIIQPLIYKFANQQQKQVLQTSYDVKPFNVKIIKLERTFIDKLFAAQKYLVDMANPKLAKPNELAKHLYDIAVLYKEKRIKDLLNDKGAVKGIEAIRRREEERRTGGVPADIKISDFLFLSKALDFAVIDMFLAMQEKYVLEDRYKITEDDLKMALKNIHEALR
jgi:hypothetical protein